MMEKLIITKLNETYCKLECDDYIKVMIQKYFCFRPNNYQFMPTYRMGKWDGYVRLYDIHRNLFPTGLLFKLVKLCNDTDIDIEWKNFISTNNIDVDYNFVTDYAKNILKLKFPVRDYQIDGVLKGLKEKHCILLSPTGTGKSLIIYILTRLILKYNKHFRILIVVPTLSLIDQMVGDFCDYAFDTGLDFNLLCQKIYSGHTKDISKQIVVSTYQSLQNMKSDYFKQFDAILVDECHTGSLKGNSNNKIVMNCINAVYKIGFSGTVQDNIENIYSLYSAFGQIYKLTNTSNEIKRGNLSEIKIVQYFLHYTKEDTREFFNKVNESKLFGDNITATYQAEIEWLNEKNYKRNFILSICKKLNNNALILFKRNEQFGEKLYNQLCKKLGHRKMIFYVVGETDKDIRNEVRKICEKQDNCIIVANYRVFSTGINIKNLHYVIFGESVKSKITTLQSIGRSLRLSSNKECAYIIDIADYLEDSEGNTNMTFKHAFDRRDIYEKENFKITTKDINCKDYIEQV